MKKYLLGGLMLSFALVLTGCGNETKTMICTMTQSGVDIELTTKFVGKKVDDMNLKYTMDLDDYPDEAIEEVKKQDFCSIVSTSTGFNDALTGCKQDFKDKTLLITGNIDVKKLDDEDASDESTPEEAKEELEKQGYTCVIK